MSFSYSSGVITQSGTDTNLSGLSGLTGITTWTSDPDSNTWGQDFYVMDASTRLDITGTLTIEPDQECLIVEGAATTGTAPNPVRVTGTLNLGVQKTGNGNTIYSESTGMNFTNRGVNVYAYFGLYVSGTFNWNGGIIRAASTLLFGSGSTVTVNNGVMYAPDNLSPQFRLSPNNATDSSKLNIHDLVLTGLSNGCKFFTTKGFNTAVFKLNNGFIQQWNGDHPKTTYSNLANGSNIASYDLEFTNGGASRGGNLIFNGVENRITYGKGGGNKYGYVQVFKPIELTPKDLDGVGISYSFYGLDIDSGNRVIGSNNGGTDGYGDPVDQDDTADIAYSGINQSGVYSDSLLIETFSQNGGTLGVSDDRTSSDTIPIKFISYNETITTWNTNLIGVGTLTEDVIMTPDLSITEPVRATVDAYTELNNPYQVYDRAKSELCANYAGEASLTVTRNGAVLEGGALNFILDGTAASAYDLTGTTMTIKCGTFIGGINTTGTITVRNGALLGGGEF
jgi:hypothetical protein